MSFVRAVIFIIALLLANRVFSQTNCDTLSGKLTKQFDNYSAKKFNQIKQKKRAKAQVFFDIGTYFRLKSDTMYKQWYSLFLDKIKSEWSSCDKGKNNSCMLFTIGKAYYFTDNYVWADNYFAKATAAKCNSPCLEYYYSETRKKIN